MIANYHAKTLAFQEGIIRVNDHPTAIRFLRKLRGGSQAHLVQADDGHFYAAKSPDNPQTKRVLINEYLAAKVFQHLGIATARMVPVLVPELFLASCPEFHVVFKDRQVPLRAGLYLGSRFEVNPEKTAIYDILPSAMMTKVVNPADFLGALIADQWLSNHDLRQFVYFRDQTSGFRALSIDHGMCLGGPQWRIIDSPLTGIYFDSSVYGIIGSAINVSPWLKKMGSIKESHFCRWIEAMPAEWLDGDTLALEILVGKLIRRQSRVPELVESAIRAHSKRFQNLLSVADETAGCVISSSPVPVITWPFQWEETSH